jgi:hypothetical protein
MEPDVHQDSEDDESITRDSEEVDDKEDLAEALSPAVVSGAEQPD